MVLNGSGEELAGTAVAQAGLFAVGAGLSRLLEASGIVPDIVLGHSAGEVAAAYAAGVLSLEDACALVAARGALMQGLPPGGAMAALAAGEDEVAAMLGRFGGGAVIAAVNGPAAVTVSGEAAAVEAAAGYWRARGRKVPLLGASRAFHSPRMDPVLAPLAEAAAALSYQEPGIALVSGLTGQPAREEDFRSAAYWAAQARQPVRYAAAVAAAYNLGGRLFIEAGPDGTLSALGPDCLPGQPGAPGAPGAQDGQDGAGGQAGVRGRCSTPRRLGAAAVRVRPGPGARLRGDGGLARGPGRPGRPPRRPAHLRVPAHRYWQAPGPAAGAGSGHPLLGTSVDLAGGGMVFTSRLSVQAQPWLADHVLAGTIVMAGTAFAELAIAAGDRVGCGRVEELALRLPLVLPPEGTVQVQVTVAAATPDGTRAVSVHARPDGIGSPWTEHASGVLAPAAPTLADVGALAEWPPPGAAPLPIDGLYEQVAGRGYEYGPAFCGLRAVWQAGEDVFAEVWLPEPARDEADRYGIHPALLDAVLHAAGAGGLMGAVPRAANPADPAGLLGDGHGLVPFAWGGVSLHAGGASVVRARLRRAGPDAVRVLAVDAAGEPVITVDSLVLRPVTAAQLDAARSQDKHPDQDSLFTVGWISAPASAGDVAAGPVAATGPGRRELVQALAAAGTDARAYPDLAALEQAVVGGAPVPGTVLAAAGAAADGTEDDGQDVQVSPEDVGDATVPVLGLVQQWLGMERLASSRLVIVTCGAVAAGSGEGVPDLAAAPVWGLVRSAAAENPGRVALADLDPAAAPEERGSLLSAAVAVLAAGEPEVAVREAGSWPAAWPARTNGTTGTPGRGRARRPPGVGPGGTVLVTGGTGTLGGLVARHLAGTGRRAPAAGLAGRGPAAPGAAALAAGLAAAGAAVTVAACDVADRAAAGRAAGRGPGRGAADRGGARGRGAGRRGDRGR